MKRASTPLDLIGGTEEDGRVTDTTSTCGHLSDL